MLNCSVCNPWLFVQPSGFLMPKYRQQQRHYIIHVPFDETIFLFAFMTRQNPPSYTFRDVNVDEPNTLSNHFIFAVAATPTVPSPPPCIAPTTPQKPSYTPFVTSTTTDTIIDPTNSVQHLSSSFCHVTSLLGYRFQLPPW